MTTKQKGKVNFAATLLLLFVLLFSSMSSVAAAPSRIVSKGTTSEKVVALTFDDGSDGTNITAILNALASQNVKATFFLTGAGAANHGSRIRDIVNRGHEIGNHSYSHPYFTQISATETRSQLDRTETLIRNLTGRTTKPFFRPPYGAYNSTVLQRVGDAGYTHTIMWTIDTLDWTGNSASTIVQRVMNGITPGAIILMHTGAGASGTPSALPTMITRLKSAGYRFVTISQLLKVTPAPTSGTRYTVKAGDTLYAIARRYGVTIQQIASANGISNVNLIRVGQVLVIPGKSGGGSTPAPTPPTTTVRYTVKRGDTLYAIARRYGVTVSQLASANKISNVNLIRVGQVLVIPGKSGGTTTPPPTTTTRRYTVKAGDTLYAISRRYGVSIQRIASANSISNPNLIRVGQVLVIP